MIKLQLLLYLGIAASVHFINIHAALSEKQGTHEGSHNPQEKDEEDIDLEKMTNKGGQLVKYQYVVVIFCEAMNSELYREEKSPPAEIDDVLQQLKTTQFPNKETLSSEDASDLDKINQYAQKVLLLYKNVLLGVPRPYLTRAHYFRLLLWLKFYMRNEPETPNEPIELTVDELLKPRDDDTHPKNLEILFPDAFNSLRDECLKITTLNKLLDYGRSVDATMALFLQLGEHDGNIDAVDSQVLDIVPKLIDHNLCEPMRQPFEMIIADISQDPDKFEAEIKKKPEEILLYINEAIHKRCEIRYERANAEGINLKLVDDVKSAPYLRNAIVLYNKAIEKKLLSTTPDEKTIKNVLQLENFPTPADDCEELQMNALLILTHNVILNFDKQIRKYYNSETKTMDGPLETCYSRLITWTYKQVSRINPNKHTSSVLVPLQDIWNNLRVKSQSNTSLDALMNQSYDEISTLDTLINFCDTGNSSPKKIHK